jgi:hypothetical protein
VDPGWAIALVDLHQRFPEALSIGGAVGNLADHHAVDWASYFIVHPGFMPPVQAGLRSHLTHGSVSYKRAALAQIDDVGGLGMADIFHQRSIAGANGVIRIDPAPMVWHDQARSPWYFVRQHFHAARSHSGLVRALGGRQRSIRLARLLGAPAAPSIRLVRVARAARKSIHRDRIDEALPWILLLLFSGVAGQVVGLVLGAGDSPSQVEG